MILLMNLRIDFYHSLSITWKRCEPHNSRCMIAALDTGRSLDATAKLLTGTPCHTLVSTLLTFHIDFNSARVSSRSVRSVENILAVSLSKGKKRSVTKRFTKSLGGIIF